jgi:hypothetical protein
MKKLLVKLLFRLLKTPVATDYIDKEKMNKWIGLQYPLKEFQNYIATRNFYILQMLGQGVARDEEYWMYVGQRIELGRLLSEAKRNFEKVEEERRKNEKTQSKKG